MKASTTLIQALRRAADRIEDPNSRYDWFRSERCNCGILAKELLGHTVNTGGGWAGLQTRIGTCWSTGKPLREIFQQLQEAGLDAADFGDIEKTNNPTVAARAGIVLTCTGTPTKNEYKHPAVAALYLRTQATLLEEQLQQEQAAEKNLRQVGTDGRALQGVNVATCAESSKPQSLNATTAERHLPQSLSPITSALAKSAPCSHLFISPGDSCVLCGFIKPATSPVQVGGGE